MALSVPCHISLVAACPKGSCLCAWSRVAAATAHRLGKRELIGMGDCMVMNWLTHANIDVGKRGAAPDTKLLECNVVWKNCRESSITAQMT